ncbi:hypothetical protein S83_029547, partial [Arachis hypogaea]
WNVVMPTIVAKSISILSDAGLGMTMFSLGLFMALQPKIIACGNTVASFAMAVRFLTGPAVMAVASVVAALPQGIVPFVFAKEYNIHPDILITGVIFGMLIALPITLVYYILLGLKSIQNLQTIFILVTSNRGAEKGADFEDSCVILEALKVDSRQRLCSSLEPLLRKIVSEEVERALAKLGLAKLAE